MRFASPGARVEHVWEKARELKHHASCIMSGMPQNSPISVDRYAKVRTVGSRGFSEGARERIPRLTFNSVTTFLALQNLSIVSPKVQVA